MTKGLVRYQQCGCFHFVPFSCYRRLPYLGAESARNLFERSLEAMRRVAQVPIHKSGCPISLAFGDMGTKNLNPSFLITDH